MSELVHNFESQVVFSNRKNNISANEPITFTIAPSGDNNYFDLNASYLTLTLEAVTNTWKRSWFWRVCTQHWN